jgi:hypothetical protein
MLAGSVLEALRDGGAAGIALAGPNQRIANAHRREYCGVDNQQQDDDAGKGESPATEGLAHGAKMADGLDDESENYAG